MHWSSELVGELPIDTPHIVNDSKTPSGRPHVGALRGVVIHDALTRALKDRGAQVTYTFGSDDYDPLDSLPFGMEDQLRPYLGFPVCNVPAPPGSEATDLAEHFIGEFFGLFAPLGVEAQQYRMRDVYRSGSFDAAIDLALRKADVIRAAYLEASGSVKPDDWYPLQVICENCGRIGTTQVTGYDGTEVTYTCHPAMVTWAEGCGHTGTTSPFGGGAKMPWKVEWAAKWAFRNVTVEGAGKDHSTSGGSRDVATLIAERAFGGAEPFNVPYEFFLVGGAKMSSSRGTGVPAQSMVELLGPFLLRFLILRLDPATAINFEPRKNVINALLHDWNRLVADIRNDRAHEAQRELFALSALGDPRVDQLADAGVDFDTVASLVSLPHLSEDDVVRIVAPAEAQRPGARFLVDSATYWLDTFADDDDRFVVRAEPDPELGSYRPVEQAFLAGAAAYRQSQDAQSLDAAAAQAALFDVARLVPIPAKDAFRSLYRSVLARTDGPRAGSLLLALSAEQAAKLLPAAPPPDAALWADSAVPYDAWLATLQGFAPGKDRVVEIRRRWAGFGVLDAVVEDKNGRHRIVRGAFDDDGAHDPDEATFLVRAAERLAQDGLGDLVVPAVAAG